MSDERRSVPRMATAGRLTIWALPVLVIAAVCLLPVSAQASGTYDLVGTWNTYSDVGYTGTFQIAMMDLSTGAFSGTGDSGAFALQGTETGSAVKFTQSSGGYVATDDATVVSTPTGLEMTGGTFTDTNNNSGNFTADLAQPPRTSDTSLNCAEGATPADPLSCTAIVSDTSGMSPAVAPTGAVALTSTNGQLSAPSCTLTAAGASTASCDVTFTPPPNIGNGSAAPQLSAIYSGDTTFGTSTDTQTLSCTSGLIFQVSGVTSTVASTNGFRTGSPVVIHGCGLSAGTVVQFGIATARATVAQPSDATPDGTSLTLNVPVQAVTGTLSVTDTASGASKTAKLAKPDPLQIDSWRNTGAFPFLNSPGTLTADDLFDEFPTSNLTTSPGVLSPWATALLMHDQMSIAGGVCYGIALTEGMLADGSLSLSQFGTAQTPFEQPSTPDLATWLDQKWLAQDSDQAVPYLFEPTVRAAGEAGILADLNRLMPGGDGWNSPVIVGIEGHASLVRGWVAHAEIAYGWAMTPLPGDPNAVTIYTSDSNVPYTSAEESDTSGGAHNTATFDSWVQVGDNGHWLAHHEGMYGKPDGLLLIPISALQGTLTVSRATFVNRRTFSVLLDPADNVEAVDGAGGKALSLDDSSSQLAIVPTVTSGPVARPAAAQAAGYSGIGELLTTDAATTVTLNAAGHHLGALWEGAGHDANLSAGAGHLRVGFNGSSGQLTVGPAPHEAAPSSSTVTLIDQLDGNRVERVLTVTGPPHVTASLGSGATLTATKGGTFKVTVSVTGHGVTPQTAVLAPIRLGAGRSASLRPASWARLSSTSFAAVISGRHTTLHSVGRLPTATVRAFSLKGRKLRLKVRVPALLAGQSSVAISVVAKLHGKVTAHGTATAPTGARARTDTVTVTLSHAPGRGGHVQVTVVTLNGGTTPSETVSTLTRDGA
jgi:hypothetical protein